MFTWSVCGLVQWFVGHVARAQLCANHEEHIGRSSCVRCRVPCGTKGQLFYQVSHRLNRFILLAEALDR